MSWLSTEARLSTDTGEKEIKRGTIGKVAGALALGTGLTGGVIAATAGTSFADYGQGTTYQVEISGNLPPNVFGPGSGGGVWFWFALTPSSPGATSGTADFQGADCIHHTPLGPTGATPDTGSNIPWTDNGTDLMIGPFTWGGGTSTVTVPDTYGHDKLTFASVMGLPFPGSAEVQVAP